MPDRRFEITAHSHGQTLQTVAAGNLSKKREMWAWGLPLWRNTHQALHGEMVAAHTVVDEGVGERRRDTCLLGLLTCVDLDIESGTDAAALGFAGDVFSQLLPVEGLYHGEQGHGVANLVGLK